MGTSSLTGSRSGTAALGIGAITKCEDLLGLGLVIGWPGLTNTLPYYYSITKENSLLFAISFINRCPLLIYPHLQHVTPYYFFYILPFLMRKILIFIFY